MAKQLPYDSSVQSEYKDGYIHDETSFDDISPYGPFVIVQKDEDGKEYQQTIDRNILNDIIEKRPEAEHGKMVRFSVFWQNNRLDVDWKGLPDNARPIRFRDGFITKDMTSGEEIKGWSGVRAGYQYNDENGKNVQEVQDL